MRLDFLCPDLLNEVSTKGNGPDVFVLFWRTRDT